MFSFKLEGVDSTSKGFKITRRPDIPSTAKDYEEHNIPGRDGALYEDLGTVQDIEIEVSCNYIAKPEEWGTRWRSIKKWLLTAHQFLVFSDDVDYCYRIKKIDLTTNERQVKYSGQFTVIFTVEGYLYLTSGQKQYSYSQVLKNDYEATYPVYYLTGQGNCVLTVNGNQCNCNVGGNLIIDTYLRLTYRQDGTLRNTDIDADYDDLKLIEGNNTITITNGISLNIMPNWRCL